MDWYHERGSQLPHGQSVRTSLVRDGWPPLLALLIFFVTLSAVPLVIAQETQPSPQTAAPESAGPGYKSASQQEQLELLRRLLGVAAPAAQTPAPGPPATPTATQPATPDGQAEPATATTQPEPTPAVQTESGSAAGGAQAAPAKSATRKSAQAKPKPASKPRPAPKPKPAAKPTAPAKAAPEPEAAPALEEASRPEEPVRPTEQPQTAATDAAPPSPASPDVEVPAAGMVIDAGNAERWKHVLAPSVYWTVARGAKLEVVDSRPIPLEPARADATERYHAQVSLRGDKKTMLNHVAGIPFPEVTDADPDAAVKLMFNFEQRLVIDDVDGRNFGCVTGHIDASRGVQAERIYRIGHFRRLFYTGRLLVDPKPAWRTPDNLRYREMLGPLNEPFDLKGAGFSYNRYLDPVRQDDSWLYYPQTKRVRRLSTAQRSEGVFGQDVDLDSYAGFAGNPAWFDWQLLGRKTVLLPLRAKHEPVKWGDKPTDFLFDDVWEPRDTYIIAARSLLSGYNFSLRVIYVDAQSFIIPITEVYDHDGQLWRAYVQQTKTDSNKAMPYAREAVYDFPMFFVAAVTVFDLQQEHATFCQWPAPDAPGEEVWYYWRGEEGSRPEDFDVAGLIQTGR